MNEEYNKIWVVLNGNEVFYGAFLDKQIADKARVELANNCNGTC